MEENPRIVGVSEAVTRMAREESGRVLALLARRFSNIDLADEAVQEALIEAASTWPTRGIPANTAGWLLTVARRKALDQLRKQASSQRRIRAASSELANADNSDSPPLPQHPASDSFCFVAIQLWTATHKLP
jgi:RNA polymerase sigma-70 factor, ECF subfamily